MMSMWKMREMVDKATNLVMNYTETEAKVREASNDDPWGPSGAQMQEIASFTFTYEQFPEVMGMLWKRMLQDNRTNWRRTYKSLLLLDYLIKNGSERVVTNAREHVYDLRSMENYAFVDENVSVFFFCLFGIPIVEGCHEFYVLIGFSILFILCVNFLSNSFINLIYYIFYVHMCYLHVKDVQFSEF